MEKFGTWLVEARRRKNMSQEALAEVLKVSRTTVSSWERGRTKPDIDMYRQIVKLLSDDAPQEPDEQPPAEGEETVPEAPATQPESAPAGVDPAAAGKRSSARLPWIIAGVAVLVCVALACALLMSHKPKQSAFQPDFFSQQTANDPDRAYLVYNHRTWEEATQGTVYACYAFTLNERNGKPFHITRMEVTLEGMVKQGSVRTFVLSADDLREAGHDPDIPAYGSFTMDGGSPKSDFGRIGVAVYGEDADGQANAFFDLIEF